jgi:peptide/nickel transport system ATP-binding protein/oligopeptide transport system ATP-binding protein
MDANKELLKVDNLSVSFKLMDNTIKAVDSVSFSINRGETLGVAGETGSGKSVTVKAIMRNLPSYAQITADTVTLEGIDLLSLSEKQLQGVWGKQIAMIFQNPTSFINPLFTIEKQITDVIRFHEKIKKEEAIKIAHKMLTHVGMPDPDAVLKSYPFQLSAGMIQRVMIALSLSCNPSLLIADEPTTALDVTIQAQILDLLANVKARTGGLILITHNLAIVKEICDKVLIMYAGKIVEWGGVHQVMDSALHPYTKGLLDAIPRIKGQNKKLRYIPGNIPSTVDLPKGCRFSPRCSVAMPICFEKEPPMCEIAPGHLAACHAISKERGN